MKKIFAGLLCLLFVVPVLVTRPVAAATPVPATDAAIPAPAITPASVPVEYVLPYPGILPTHPLYFLKRLRDTIIEMSIADPLIKSEFYITQADKKLNMGVSLKQAGKAKEAASAFAESLASRGQAVGVLEAHRKSGNTIPGHLIEKLSLSLAKHTQVLQESGQSQEAVEALRERALQMPLGDK